MNKKAILFAAAGIILIIVIIIVAIIARKSSSTVTTIPPKFTVLIQENGGKYKINLQGANNKITPINNALANSYIIISVNKTGDVLTALCPLGYANTAANSPTKSNIVRDVGIGYEMGINDGQENDLSLTCAQN